MFYGVRNNNVQRSVLAPAAIAIVSTTATAAASTAQEKASHQLSKQAGYHMWRQAEHALGHRLRQVAIMPTKNASDRIVVSPHQHVRMGARFKSSATTSSSSTSAAAHESTSQATPTSTSSVPGVNSASIAKRNATTVTLPPSFTSSSQQCQSKKSWMEWYEHHLKERPVQTKMMTGSFLWGLGDWGAQVVPALVEQNNGNHADDTIDLQSYDLARTARAAFFGFAIHAPTSHLHFNFLEWLTHRVGVQGSMQIPLFKAFMEQFVYWSWFSNSLYHGAMGAMQGHGPTQIYDRIADVLWETQKAQWAFWIPVQLLNFRYVPVRHQLNVVLVTSVAWTAFLSAWYPPEKEEKKDIDERTK